MVDPEPVRTQLPLSDIILCSVAVGSGGEGDAYEGGALYESGIYISYFGETPLDEVPSEGHGEESSNPVVETDVPAEHSSDGGALVGTGLLLAVARALGLTRLHGLSRR